MMLFMSMSSYSLSHPLALKVTNQAANSRRTTTSMPQVTYCINMNISSKLGIFEEDLILQKKKYPPGASRERYVAGAHDKLLSNLVSG
jgi:hypothetical protein